MDKLQKQQEEELYPPWLYSPKPSYFSQSFDQREYQQEIQPQIQQSRLVIPNDEQMITNNTSNLERFWQNKPNQTGFQMYYLSQSYMQRKKNSLRIQYEGYQIKRDKNEKSSVLKIFGNKIKQELIRLRDNNNKKPYVQNNTIQIQNNTRQIRNTLSQKEIQLILQYCQKDAYGFEKFQELYGYVKNDNHLNDKKQMIQQQDCRFLRKKITQYVNSQRFLSDCMTSPSNTKRHNALLVLKYQAFFPRLSINPAIYNTFYNLKDQSKQEHFNY